MAIEDQLLDGPAALAPVTVEPVARRRRSVGDWLLAASSYLPLLLMGLLALGTWWLVRNTPVLEPPRTAAPLRHEPDYMMSDFLVQRFGDDGAMRARLEGDALRHYPDTDTLEVDNARLHAVAPDGQVTHASARLAVANADGSEVQLRGGAQVLREAFGDEAPIEFTGEFLHFLVNDERVRSHLPVVVTQGATRIRADAFDYDHADRVVRLRGEVRAEFEPGVAQGRRR